MFENIPLNLADIGFLMEEKVLHYLSLVKSPSKVGLSGKEDLYLMEFVSSLRTSLKDEMYLNVIREMRSRIPDLIYTIEHDSFLVGEDNKDKRIAFLRSLHNLLGKEMDVIKSQKN